MKNKRVVIRGILLALLFAISTVGIAAAEEDPPPTEEPDTEESTILSGTVIDVDEEEGTVTLLVENEEGELEEKTVYLADADYDHPIVELLSSYFGEATLEDYLAALESLEAELEDEDGNPVEGTVLEVTEIENGDGTTSWEVTVDTGEEEEPVTVVIDDEELAEEFEAALDTLEVEFEVEANADEDGEDGEGSEGDTTTYTVTSSTGDDIETYHDDGIGFGVLVKIYAIADEQAAACEAAEDAADDDDATGDDDDATGDDDDATGDDDDATGDDDDATGEEETCGVTVEELIEMYESGMSIGQLFKEYGKPAMLGVGHVRQGLAEDGTSSDEDGEGGTETVCHNEHTITVGASAVSAHLAHGDTLGACD